MENSILEKVANKIDTHQDFDGVLSYYTAKKILPFIKGKELLEAGCSTGVITEELLKHAATLDIVEGSKKYSDIVKEKFGNKIRNIYVSYFEDFVPPSKYDVVIYGNVLHHLSKPLEQLIYSKNWLKVNGEIIITVPNMNSLHRQLGVESKIISKIDDTTERNIFFEQPGRYTKEKIEELMVKAGYEIIESSAFFMKPFDHNTMQNLNLSNEKLDGLHNMGIKYPDLACQLFILARKIN